MDDCKWVQDEICMNPDCPMRAGYCPVRKYGGVCEFKRGGDSNGGMDQREGIAPGAGSGGSDLSGKERVS